MKSIHAISHWKNISGSNKYISDLDFHIVKGTYRIIGASLLFSHKIGESSREMDSFILIRRERSKYIS
jgi:hypothetical protein